VLERKYATFDGLNLTFETLEGLAKHNGPLVDEAGVPLGVQSEGAGQGALVDTLVNLGLAPHLGLAQHASLEAQVAAVADDIAYYNHDLDDGLRAGLITLDDLRGVPLAGPLLEEALGLGARERQRVIYEVNRRLITLLIDDAVAETRKRLAKAQPQSVMDVKAAGQTLVAFSEPTVTAMRHLKAFLSREVWRNPKVMTVMRDAERCVERLVTHYMARPGDIPRPWGEVLNRVSPQHRARRVADFVAGMTDRYAMEEHRRLFDATPALR
jgi:dGTPase